MGDILQAALLTAFLDENYLTITWHLSVANYDRNANVFQVSSHKFDTQRVKLSYFRYNS